MPKYFYPFLSPQEQTNMLEQNCTQTYQSVTSWQAEEWQVEVTISGFFTIEEAANFGAKKAKKLKHEPNADHLILIDDSEHCHRIPQEGVKLYKLKPEGQAKLMISMDDLVLVELKIQEYSHIEGLNRGFGSQSYGVKDKDNCFIPTYLFT